MNFNYFVNVYFSLHILKTVSLAETIKANIKINDFALSVSSLSKI